MNYNMFIESPPPLKFFNAN